MHEQTRWNGNSFQQKPPKLRSQHELRLANHSRRTNVQIEGAASSGSCHRRSSWRQQ